MNVVNQHATAGDLRCERGARSGAYIQQADVNTSETLNNNRVGPAGFCETKMGRNKKIPPC